MDSIQWIKDFSRKKVLNNKDMVGILRYDEYSLWWFLEWLMEYGRFHFPNLKSILENPKQTPKKNNLGMYMKFARFLLRKVIWVFFAPFNKHMDKNKKTVASVSTLNQLLYNPKQSIFEVCDRAIPILSYIEDSNILLIDIPYKKEIGIKVFSRAIKEGIMIAPIESFVGIKEIIVATKHFLIYRKQWKKVRSNLTFLEPDIKNHIINNFDFFFSLYLYLTLLEIEGYKRLFKKYNIDVLCTFDSFGPSALKPRIVYKGKMVGIQPGSWGDYAVEYTHSKEDISTYPLVDYLVVFDNQTKERLVQSKNIEPDRIRVIGNYKKDDIYYKLKHYNIQLEEESLLLISQPFHDKKEFQTFLDESFKFFKMFPNESKVVRPHPGEINLSFYESLIKKYSISNIKFSRDEDVVYPLSKAKLVIGAFSTALSEASLLGKDVVIVDVLNKGYSKLNGGLKSVQSSNELSQIFNEIKIEKKKIELTPSVYKKIAEFVGGIA